jgi:hypothetical protein
MLGRSRSITELCDSDRRFRFAVTLASYVRTITQGHASVIHPAK